MTRSRKLVLGAYFLAVLLGTLPFIVYSFREIQYDSTDFALSLLRVPTIPLVLLIWILGELLFDLPNRLLLHIATGAAPVYLALLYWPMPLYVFAPEKWSRPRVRQFATTYLVLLLSAMSWGILLMFMIDNSPR